MILDLIEDFVKLALIIACFYFVLYGQVRLKRPPWFQQLGKRRFIVLSALVLATVTIKLSEDVLGGESGPIDKAMLLFIHSHVPSTLTVFFKAVTFSASPTILLPLATVATIALLYANRRFEVLLLLIPVISGTTLVWTVKTVVGRARPALWDTEWYWGSSFPSGHTLAVAAFATAAALCLTRIWPSMRKIGLSIAISWISLVAISRLVLGVHWPTDVLSAMAVGGFLSLATSIALEFFAGRHKAE